MTRARNYGITTLLVLGSAVGPRTADAQALGAFRWQLQPYCNVLTVTVVQAGSQYHIDGTDDQCNAARRASVVGLAFPNPDGAVGFGLTIVTTPGGTPLHVDATISITNLSGTWRDSGGNSGGFVFTPGAGTGGSQRPVPAGGIAPGSITGAQMAAGTITAAQFAPGAVTTAAASVGTCPVGAYLRGFRPDGSMLCEPLGTPPTITIVDRTNDVGRHTSLAIGRDGRPVISYYDRDNLDLRVAICATSACTGTAAITLLDGVGDVGQDSSLAIGPDGRPVVSYWDRTAAALKLAVCATPTCAGVTTIVTVDDNVGGYTSLAIRPDGRPVISYYDLGRSALKVAVCATPTCSGTPTVVTLDRIGDVGVTTSLAIALDGRPVVSYYDATNQDLKVAVCATPSCTSAPTIATVDGTGSAGLYSSAAFDLDGRLVISYYDATNLDLMVAVCATATCAGTPTITPVDNAEVNGFTSLAIGLDGRPVIGYYDSANGDLKVAKCNSRTCAP